MGVDLGYRDGQLGDGVVAAHGTGAVAARAEAGQGEVLIDLLAGLDVERDTIALGVEPTTCPLVQREGGVDQLAVIAHQVGRAIERLVGLLAAGDRGLDRVARPEALFTQADQSVDVDRRHRLVVIGPAAIEIAVLLHQGERIAGPVAASGLDDVDMRQQKDGLGVRVGPVQHRDHATLARVVGRRDERDVLVGIAGRLQARAHPVGGQGAVAVGVFGVGLDQLLVEGAEGDLVGTDGSLG